MSEVMEPASPETRARLKAWPSSHCRSMNGGVGWRFRCRQQRSAYPGSGTWFRRRYPTVGERLTYARRAYKRWTGQASP